MLSHSSHARLFVTLWTVACQAPLSMGILQARVMEWVSMPSSRGIFVTQGSNPGSPALAGEFLTTRPPGKSFSFPT